MKKKIILGALAFIVVVVAGFGIAVLVTLRSIEVEKVTDDLHVIYGAGGNVGVLKTSEGAVIVDTMTTSMQGDLIREKAEELTGQKVAMVINTHYHLDHTHGNPAFEKGVRVVATMKTLEHLKNLDGDYFSGDAAALLPSETFETEKSITLGDKTIKLFHPGRGHTDGDLIVLFVDENAVHMGDLFFYRHYPNIDLEAGASLKEWVGSIDRVLPMPFEKVIPGHGPVTNRTELKQFQSFIAQLGQLGREAVANNVDLETFVDTAELTEDAGYTEMRMLVPLGLDRAFVLKRSWEEASASK